MSDKANPADVSILSQTSQAPSPTVVAELRIALRQFAAYGEWRVRDDDVVDTDYGIANDGTEEDEAGACFLHQTIATEGFAKLLACNRWDDQPEEILAQLLLNYYNPNLLGKREDADESFDEDDEDEEALDDKPWRQSTSMRQCLHPFFLAYSSSQPARQKQFLEAGILAFRHLVRGHFWVLPRSLQPIDDPSGPPQQCANAKQIGEFLRLFAYSTDCACLKSILETSGNRSKEATEQRKETMSKYSLHENLCVDLLNEALADPVGSRKAVKAFAHVHLYQTSNMHLLIYLLFLIDKLDETLEDRVSKNHVKKLREAVLARIEIAKKTEEGSEYLDENGEVDYKKDIPDMELALEQYLAARGEYLELCVPECMQSQVTKKERKKKTTQPKSKRLATKAPKQEDSDSDLESIMQGSAQRCADRTRRELEAAESDDENSQKSDVLIDDDEDEEAEEEIVSAPPAKRPRRR
eukprot:NODE_1256_length_1808_cov_146.528190_g1191_i0.p1 GENE.NODE_1256_length_1808_cov_146.528190_g1191_i0~~NODE_1256_length_1808_cov_146.528190_g1191_i0.p1  ORF type:complete len:468 (+),score=113.23 NODE_1256_length_1808_cov_146.528190_g1191_i0:149-1552(+)